MALDFDSIYHTLTMVKILKDQGSTLTAMELAEKILEKDPQNQKVREILEALKTEARASFDRFRQAGSHVAKPPSDPRGEDSGKVGQLRSLLQRVQEYRRAHG